MGASQSMPDCTSPYVVKIQEKYNVQVMFRTRPKLHATLVVVKGCEWEVSQVKEATILLIRYMCKNLAVSSKNNQKISIRFLLRTWKSILKNLKKLNNFLTFYKNIEASRIIVLHLALFKYFLIIYFQFIIPSKILILLFTSINRYERNWKYIYSLVTFSKNLIFS